jgi:ribosome-binding protein aMBF1 (putative translation factor)
MLEFARVTPEYCTSTARPCPGQGRQRAGYVKIAAVVYIGENLRKARERRYLSQRALAAEAGVSADTILKLENDRWEPRPSTVRKLAAALDIDPDQLTGFDKE